MNKFKKILLVEDDKNDTELTLDTLEQLKIGNSIDITEDGEEALDYLFRRGKFISRIEENPILVLLDIKMPKLSGLEVLAVMEKEELLKSIPVVMLTSSQEESDLMESYLLGVNTYVMKPLDPDTFMRTLKQLGIFWINVNNHTFLIKNKAKLSSIL